MFLNGNFVALPAFKNRYGTFVEGSGNTIPTKWQSALFQSGQCGAFVGVFAAGPVTNRLGYRWTTLLALVMMNATIFISFFVSAPLDWPSPLTDLLLRPTRLRFSPSAKPSRASLGASLSRTRPHMRVRSCH